MMRTLGNILWFILGGFIVSVCWFVLGILLCITLIGIPFGKQCLKLARVNLAPFKKKIDVNFSEYPFANLIWLLLFGWEIGLMYLVQTIALCISIIGAPLAIGSFKLIPLGLFPFGADIKDIKDTKNKK